MDGLRAKTGNDKEIQDYVMQFPEANEFIDKLDDMIKFLIPNYISAVSYTHLDVYKRQSSHRAWHEALRYITGWQNRGDD